MKKFDHYKMNHLMPQQTLLQNGLQTLCYKMNGCANIASYKMTPSKAGSRGICPPSHKANFKGDAGTILKNWLCVWKKHGNRCQAWWGRFRCNVGLLNSSRFDSIWWVGDSVHRKAKCCQSTGELAFLTRMAANNGAAWLCELGNKFSQAWPGLLKSILTLRTITSTTHIFPSEACARTIFEHLRNCCTNWSEFVLLQLCNNCFTTTCVQSRYAAFFFTRWGRSLLHGWVGSQCSDRNYVIKVALYDNAKWTGWKFPWPCSGVGPMLAAQPAKVGESVEDGSARVHRCEHHGTNRSLHQWRGWPPKVWLQHVATWWRGSNKDGHGHPWGANALTEIHWLKCPQVTSCCMQSHECFSVSVKQCAILTGSLSQSLADPICWMFQHLWRTRFHENGAQPECNLCNEQTTCAHRPSISFSKRFLAWCVSLGSTSCTTLMEIASWRRKLLTATAVSSIAAIFSKKDFPSCFSSVSSGMKTPSKTGWHVSTRSEVLANLIIMVHLFMLIVMHCWSSAKLKTTPPSCSVNRTILTVSNLTAWSGSPCPLPRHSRSSQ